MIENIRNKFKSDIAMCGGGIIDLRSKVIAFGGLLLLAVQAHLPVYSFYSVNVSSFGFWLLRDGHDMGMRMMIDAASSGAVRFLVAALLAVYWVMLISAGLNFAEYKQPFSRFWVKVLIGYFCRIIFSAAYVFSMARAINDFKKKYDEAAYMKLNYVNMVIVMICIVCLIITCVKVSAYEAKRKSALTNKAEISIIRENGDTSILRQSEISRKLFISEDTKELFTFSISKTTKAAERLSDKQQFSLTPESEKTLMKIYNED